MSPFYGMQSELLASSLNEQENKQIPEALGSNVLASFFCLILIERTFVLYFVTFEFRYRLYLLYFMWVAAWTAP